MIDHQAKCVGIAEERRYVAEDYSRSRIIRNGSDRFANLAQSIHAHTLLRLLRPVSAPPPYQRAIVGRHGMVGGELEALRVREALERFEVADAAARIARFQ